MIDMNKLQSEISQTAMPQDPERKRLFSSRERDAERQERQATMGIRQPLATIAEMLKRLIWDDAERLGQLITQHYTTDNGKGSMPAAVQKAADDLLAESEQK
jgi:hypothetical protein